MYLAIIISGTVAHDYILYYFCSPLPAISAAIFIRTGTDTNNCLLVRRPYCLFYIVVHFLLISRSIYLHKFIHKGYKIVNIGKVIWIG